MRRLQRRRRDARAPAHRGRPDGRSADPPSTCERLVHAGAALGHRHAGGGELVRKLAADADPEHAAGHADSASIVISCLAVQAGGRSPSSITLKPSPIRSVTAAAAARQPGGVEPGGRAGEVIADPDGVEVELLGQARRRARPASALRVRTAIEAGQQDAAAASVIGAAAARPARPHV